MCLHSKINSHHPGGQHKRSVCVNASKFRLSSVDKIINTISHDLTVFCLTQKTQKTQKTQTFYFKLPLRWFLIHRIRTHYACANLRQAYPSGRHTRV